MQTRMRRMFRERRRGKEDGKGKRKGKRNGKRKSTNNIIFQPKSMMVSPCSILLLPEGEDSQDHTFPNDCSLNLLFQRGLCQPVSICPCCEPRLHVRPPVWWSLSDLCALYGAWIYSVNRVLFLTTVSRCHLLIYNNYRVYSPFMRYLISAILRLDTYILNTGYTRYMYRFIYVYIYRFMYVYTHNYVFRYVHCTYHQSSLSYDVVLWGLL